MIRKIFLVAASVMMMSTYTFAQNESKSANEDNSKTYKLAVSKGKLNLDLGRVTVEGYNGNEIVFSTKTRSRDNDERAKGLRSINSLGLEDNTELGINVVEKNGVTPVIRRVARLRASFVYLKCISKCSFRFFYQMFTWL